MSHKPVPQTRHCIQGCCWMPLGGRILVEPPVSLKRFQFATCRLHARVDSLLSMRANLSAVESCVCTRAERTFRGRCAELVTTQRMVNAGRGSGCISVAWKARHYERIGACHGKLMDSKSLFLTPNSEIV